MKTIILNIPNGWCVKSYLLTDFLKNLSMKNNLVVLSPLANNHEFKKKFKLDNVIFEELYIQKIFHTFFYVYLNYLDEELTSTFATTRRFKWLIQPFRVPFDLRMDSK